MVDENDENDEKVNAAAPEMAEPKPIRNWDRLPDSPNCVTIFGAGIAGLTAAHELVERGFQVQVWERQRNDRHPEKGCDVGGLARTQWSAVRWPVSRDVDPLPNQRLPFAGRRTRPIGHIRQLIYMTWSPGLFANLAGEIMGLRSVIEELVKGISRDSNPKLRVDYYAHAVVHAEMKWESIRAKFETVTKDVGSEIPLEPVRHEAPNPEWPLLIMSVVDDLGRQLKSERQLWPASPSEEGTDEPRPSRPPIVGAFPIKQDSAPAWRFHVVRPTPDLIEAVLPGLREKFLTEKFGSNGIPSKCLVKIYDTSATRLVGGEFEQRAAEVSREIQMRAMDHVYALAVEAIQELGDDALGRLASTQVEVIQGVLETEKAEELARLGEDRMKLQAEWESSERGRWDQERLEAGLRRLEQEEEELQEEWKVLDEEVERLRQPVPMELLRVLAVQRLRVLGDHELEKLARSRFEQMRKAATKPSEGNFDQMLHFLRAVDVVPLPTFGAMDLAYDVRFSGESKLRLEVQLHHSRHPDWTDMSIQFDEESPIHLRRLWSPTVDQIYVTSSSQTQTISSSAEPAVGPSGKRALSSLVLALEASARTEVVYVEITSRQVVELSQAEKDRRVALVRRMLEAEVGRRYQWQLEYRWIDEFSYSSSDRPPPEVEVAVAFRPRERWLPGEHGYRFFPSFYHHLFDTMKRTPLLDVEEKPRRMQAQERAAGMSSPEPFQYVESGRTAFDNLHPTSSYVLAFGKAQRSSQLSRVPFSSLEEARAYLQIVFGPRELGGFGFSPRDVGRLVLKVLQFATSCEKRRKEYEEISWWDYLDGDTFSPNAQYLLQRLPEALVAMDAHESDARTQWVPFIQILLDQVRPDHYRDGTLRGPTTEAWLVPWRRYLEAQGVEFISGELEGFELVEVSGQRRVHPRAVCFDPRYTTNLGDPPLRPGYFVLAVSAEEARRLGEEYVKLKSLEDLSYDDKSSAHEDDSDLHAVSRLGGEMTLQELDRELHQARPNSDFRHFAGLQYYFAEDVFWIDGHVYYPDSSWSITSISQARFWQDKMDWEHGYRGILSAIIGTWDVESPALGKTAWECSEEELAEEVWRQIKEGLQNQQARVDAGIGRFARRTPLAGAPPEPLYWHLDQGVSAERDSAGRVKGYRNRTPFLIATPGRFSERPGRLETGHVVEHGFVLAGYYTQTYTRIPSMEAANESARHAVNAILRHLEVKAAPGFQYRRAYCDIWNPEDREIDDFRLLKDLDENLHARGKPHVMEILDLDELTKNLLKGGALDPLDPLRLLSRLTRLYQSP